MRFRIPWASVFLSVLVASAPSSLAASPWPPAFHSPHVKAFEWEPATPVRSQTVQATAVLVPEASPSQIVLRVCRVQAYSCRAPIVMTTLDPNRPTQYGAEVSWDRNFFQGVTQVGLSLLLQFPNQSVEESPLEHWPERPTDLPPEGAIYYYYSLPPEPKGVPATSFASLLVVFCLASWTLWWRRSE